MSRHRVFAAAPFVATGFAALPAMAQNITAEPQAIAAILREQDIWATVETDNGGDPMIEAKFEEGTPFRVYFYGCEEKKNCTSVQFGAAFTKTKAGASEMVKWNKEYRFARAYLDNEGDPVLEMDVNLAEGGISRPLFRDTIELWDALLVEYSKLLYPEAEAKPTP